MRHATTCISPSTLSTARSTAWNPTTVQILPSVSDIAVVCWNESQEDAILIAQSEIALLDDISLDDDIPDDLSDTGEDVEIGNFMENQLS